MGFLIKEINYKDNWEKFLLECEEKTFLQSFNWGEFQKMMGNKIWRLGIYEISNLIGVALVIKVAARRGTFLLLPHAPPVALAREGGPTLKYEVLNTLLEELKKIAKEEKADFIRIAPIWERNKENIKIFKDLGFRKAPIHIHPELTWELDIKPSEEKLLMGMRKTTRYLIRKAQKNKDIQVEQAHNLEGIEKFNRLYQETKKRHHFAPFSLDYLKNEFLAFQPTHQISVSLGKYKNEVVSGGVFVFWQKIGFYHHGASSLKYPKIPVSYLLLWEAIKEAKRRGCQKFNFWGIAPVFAEAKTGIFNFQFSIFNKIQNSKFKKHPWTGLTLFKMRFGGDKKEYVKTQDIPLSKKYWLNYIIENLRKTKRGL